MPRIIAVFLRKSMELGYRLFSRENHHMTFMICGAMDKEAGEDAKSKRKMVYLSANKRKEGDKMKKLSLLVILAILCGGCTEKAVDPLREGLIAEYLFSGNAKDSSGNENNGEVKGATLTADRNGAANCAYAFHERKWIEVPNSQSLQSITGAVTLAAWVKPTDYPGTWGVVLCKRNDGGYPRQFGLAVGDGRRLKIVIEDNGNDNDPGNSLIPVSSIPRRNEWHHLVVTADGALARAYIDGELVGEKKTTWTPKTIDHPLLIGKDPPAHCDYFHGAIDDIRIYNRALSAEEVGQLLAR